MVSHAGPFDELGGWLERLSEPARAALRPVVFECDETGQSWLIDPAGAPVVRFGSAGQPAPGTLRLRCAPALLTRLLDGAPFCLEEDDLVGWDGSLEDLLPLADALEALSAEGEAGPTR
jgi:hypothetical protein